MATTLTNAARANAAADSSRSVNAVLANARWTATAVMGSVRRGIASASESARSARPIKRVVRAGSARTDDARASLPGFRCTWNSRMLHREHAFSTDECNPPAHSGLPHLWPKIAADPASCGERRDPCDKQRDCCWGVYDMNKCVCLPDGYPCPEDRVCCSRSCVDNLCSSE